MNVVVKLISIDCLLSCCVQINATVDQCANNLHCSSVLDCVNIVYRSRTPTAHTAHRVPKQKQARILFLSSPVGNWTVSDKIWHTVF